MPLANTHHTSAAEQTTAVEPGVTKQSFGKTTDGKEVDLYTLRNANGMTTTITNYGGIIVSCIVPGRDGKMSDVVLGFDNLDGYLGKHPYFGAIVGRYCNRIAKGRFQLGGKEYRLAVNNGENHLHGGLIGFDKVVWDATIGPGPEPSVELSYRSKDGEEGYPGNLEVTVVYTLTDQNEIKIEYRATTDKPTPVNLTNHSYFNLAGQGEGNILEHQMMIDADHFNPVDKSSIPTGELRDVTDTPMDFRTPKAIGQRIEQDNQQLKFGSGYDHNYVLDNDNSGELELAARVYEPKSGRILEVLTTEPGIQFYTGNFLDGSIVGKRKKNYLRRYAFCLETQHYPDSPNKPDFPSTILKPGDAYETTTVYRFTTD